MCEWVLKENMELNLPLHVKSAVALSYQICVFSCAVYASFIVAQTHSIVHVVKCLPGTSKKACQN